MAIRGLFGKVYRPFSGAWASLLTSNDLSGSLVVALGWLTLYPYT
jgi:hypothetical protein